MCRNGNRAHNAQVIAQAEFVNPITSGVVADHRVVSTALPNHSSSVARFTLVPSASSTSTRYKPIFCLLVQSAARSVPSAFTLTSSYHFRVTSSDHALVRTTGLHVGSTIPQNSALLHLAIAARSSMRSRLSLGTNRCKTSLLVQAVSGTRSYRIFVENARSLPGEVL